MLNKLDHYGFREDVNSFFKHYFTNRKQYVNMRDVSSDCENINIGLTQGGILSPFLFNIFINDLSYFSLSRGFNVTLFADDAVFYISDPDFKSLTNKLNNFITDLCKWLLCNKLSPNVRQD